MIGAEKAELLQTLGATVRLEPGATAVLPDDVDAPGEGIPIVEATEEEAGSVTGGGPNESPVQAPGQPAPPTDY